MGDRANVYVKESAKTGVFLYTHWSGAELPGILQKALEFGEDRLDDPSYLARIIFCRMVGAEGLMDETGFGISSLVGDGDDHVLIVDGEAGTVAVGKVPEGQSVPIAEKTHSIAAFVKKELPERDAWEALR